MKINEIATKDDADIKTVTKENYGQEAIFDINSVSPDFFKKKTIREFAEKLCDEIGMKRGPSYMSHIWGEEKEDGIHTKGEGAIKADGLSCVQFLYSSSVTIHALDEIEKVFINIFSCKTFDFEKAKKFIKDNVDGTIVKEYNIIRK